MESGYCLLCCCIEGMLKIYDYEYGCVNLSMVFEWFGAYDCLINFVFRILFIYL